MMSTARTRNGGFHAEKMEVLDDYFRQHPQSRSYILDDQGDLRKNIAVFLNDELIRDRDGLSDPVSKDDNVFVIQALTGG